MEIETYCDIDSITSFSFIRFTPKFSTVCFKYCGNCAVHCWCQGVIGTCWDESLNVPDPFPFRCTFELFTSERDGLIYLRLSKSQMPIGHSSIWKCRAWHCWNMIPRPLSWSQTGVNSLQLPVFLIFTKRFQPVAAMTKIYSDTLVITSICEVRFSSSSRSWLDHGETS